MNNITISGRVGRDAELRVIPSGTPVLSFPVASSKKVNQVEKTTWFECSLFGKRAESLQQYITKGGQVVVTGSVELEQFQKSDGTSGAKIKVFVTDIDLVGGRPSGQQAQQPQQGFGSHAPQQRQQAQPAQQHPSPSEFDDSDIPF
jgi:single-strand DNA-binding protein